MSKETLEAMGFAPEDIENAIKNTDGSVEQAIDWLDAHQDGGANSQATESTERKEEEPKGSLDERLKLLQERAAKAREEQKKRELQDRRNLMAINKRSQAEAEEAKRDLQYKQAQRDAALRRKEAKADRAYRDQLRKQIEQDRLEREAKERELRKSATPTAAPAAPAAPKPQATGAVRMRVRHGQSTITKSLDASTPVSTLGSEIADELGITESFVLQTTFPTREINVEGNSESVGEAGLANANVSIKIL